MALLLSVVAAKTREENGGRNDGSRVFGVRETGMHDLPCSIYDCCTVVFAECSLFTMLCVLSSLRSQVTEISLPHGVCVVVPSILDVTLSGR